MISDFNIYCRKEGKHKQVKMYTKNTSNRVNISVSIAEKVQYQNALRVLESEGLEDIITTCTLYKKCLKDKVYLIRGRYKCCHTS